MIIHQIILILNSFTWYTLRNATALPFSPHFLTFSPVKLKLLQQKGPLLYHVFQSLYLHPVVTHWGPLS